MLIKYEIIYFDLLCTLTNRRINFLFFITFRTLIDYYYFLFRKTLIRKFYEIVFNIFFIDNQYKLQNYKKKFKKFINDDSLKITFIFFFISNFRFSSYFRFHSKFHLNFRFFRSFYFFR